MAKFRLPKSLVIFDLEATGTNTETASMIQIGAIIMNKEGKINEKSFNKYVLPYTPEWTEGAEKVHGISLSKLQKIGQPLEEVLSQFELWLIHLMNKSGGLTHLWKKIAHSYYLAQWSCGWDVTILGNAYKHLNRKFPFHWKQFDIASIVRWELAKRGELYKKCGEAKCAWRLGVEVDKEKQHDGLYDAQLTGLILEKLIEETR